MKRILAVFMVLCVVLSVTFASDDETLFNVGIAQSIDGKILIFTGGPIVSKESFYNASEQLPERHLNLTYEEGFTGNEISELLALFEEMTDENRNRYRYDSDYVIRSVAASTSIRSTETEVMAIVAAYTPECSDYIDSFISVATNGLFIFMVEYENYEKDEKF